MEKEFIVYVYLIQLQPVRRFECKHCIIHSPFQEQLKTLGGGLWPDCLWHSLQVNFLSNDL